MYWMKFLGRLIYIAVKLSTTELLSINICAMYTRLRSKQRIGMTAMAMASQHQFIV